MLLEWFFWQVLRFLPPPCLTREGGNGQELAGSSWSIPWSMADFSVSVPLGNKLIKNCRLPSWFKKHASWFRKRVSWYMTWNTWELKLNSTILTHSKSKLMLILSILIVNWWIWIIKLHLWYFVTFGVAYNFAVTVMFFSKLVALWSTYCSHQPFIKILLELNKVGIPYFQI